MKKFSFFLYVFLWLFTVRTFAQSFAPVGAVWYYDEGFSFVNSNNRDYIQFTAIKDKDGNYLGGKKIIKIR